ncbi:U6 snRNA phosphodiesterase [Thalassophryne amazonica]|uniref:U6 snRNA phosphodiesterase n=1 Tax=Thalassophryne amazonica TaxID=390379 RepID=UPI0014726811|nr:U6 snRNA phosphodiesterase [Thalassophryne amazonica]
MLVGYSSSSEEENEAEKLHRRQKRQQDAEAEDGLAIKKLKTEERLYKPRLPIPGCLLNMFPEDVDPETEDSSLHGGRVRSFKHERGNWATYVYLPYSPDEDFRELLEQLLSTAKACGVDLTPQEEFHLSLSQTVVLRHHWIQPFTQSLRTGSAPCKRFMCLADRLKVYCNAEKTRTFLGMEVSAGHAQLLDLVRVVDRTMTEFGLDTFYKDPSFHVSLVWCVGDQTAPLQACIQRLQSLIDDPDEGPFHMSLDCTELRCRTGNKIFRFCLDS